MCHTLWIVTCCTAPADIRRKTNRCDPPHILVSSVLAGSELQCSVAIIRIYSTSSLLIRLWWRSTTVKATHFSSQHYYAEKMLPWWIISAVSDTALYFRQRLLQRYQQTYYRAAQSLISTLSKQSQSKRYHCTIYYPTLDATENFWQKMQSSHYRESFLTLLFPIMHCFVSQNLVDAPGHWLATFKLCFFKTFIDLKNFCVQLIMSSN